ncbi:hypothetical protein MAM1_0101d05239 [Mucor ambiguus]|uniref:Uncharacterized protein n=1 Tax=Mucor ambiguus TaxID=91626 RepID=A0A0C9MER7_9FUNG|nr:hypothetical protein MAM1_0101d05239 [Mucor ambiguus]
MQPSISNHFSTDRGRRSSCCSHCDHSSSNPATIVNEFEPQALSLTPPLENVYFKEQNQPFSCIYLLNLFLAPDMTRYLAETSISDDVYALPVHLQTLICEARMEVLVSKQKNHPLEGNAIKRLEKVREYIKSIALNDTAAIISTLSELIRDDDEMSIILEQ